jgi:cysteine-rich repeat protein
MRSDRFALIVVGAIGCLAAACGRHPLGSHGRAEDAGVSAGATGTSSSTGATLPPSSGGVVGGVGGSGGRGSGGTSVGAGGASGSSGQAPWRKTCGNGVVEAGESCDDQNQLNGDGCTVECCLETMPICCDTVQCLKDRRRPCHCGDGFVDVGEGCDDGNLAFGDGCNGYCEIETGTCGNGTLEGTEECDDGNLLFGDGCDPSCRKEPSCRR